MSDYEHARRGRGNAVHAIGKGGQLCGAGKNSIGTRFARGLRYTDDPITCMTCLKRVVEQKRARPLPMDGTDSHVYGEK